MADERFEIVVSPDELPEKFLEACRILLEIKKYSSLNDSENLLIWIHKGESFLYSLNLDKL